MVPYAHDYATNNVLLTIVFLLVGIGLFLLARDLWDAARERGRRSWFRLASLTSFGLSLFAFCFTLIALLDLTVELLESGAL